jgi:uncharacterized membrane protein
LVLATSIFSTQGVLPFTPNFLIFICVLVVLIILVIATLVGLFNWDMWFQPALDYITTELKRRMPIKSNVGAKWDLEKGD